ncbi:hypothetical protein quinque_003693 [Culex quinquefasciatus]
MLLLHLPYRALIFARGNIFDKTAKPSSSTSVVVVPSTRLPLHTGRSLVEARRSFRFAIIRGFGKLRWDEAYLGVNVYKTEWPCARQGGLCVHRADCKSPTTKSGLCPESAHRGVECCYEVMPSQLSLPCNEYQGECMKHCNALGLRRPANDCQEGEHCCVLTL